MKRGVLVVLLALLVSVLVFAGCATPAPAPAPTAKPAPAPSPTAAPKPTAAPDVIKISFSTQYPENNRMHINNHKPVLDAIEKRSNGRIKFVLFAGGALGSAEEQYDIVRTGKSDMGTTSGLGYTPGRFPLSEVFTFPLAYGSSPAAQLLVNEVGMRMLQKETADTKVLCYNQSQLFYIYANKPIKTLEDMKGIKTRSSGGIITPALEALGAVPVTMGLPDVYLSLKTGVISASITGPGALPQYKLWEVVNHVVVLPFGFAAQVVNFNPDSWKKIPDDLKVIIEEEAAKTGTNVIRMLVEDEPKVHGEITQRGGTVYNLPEQEQARWASAIKVVIDKWVKDREAKGLPAQELMNLVREKAKEKNVPFPY